jgi:hypothetical protein
LELDLEGTSRDISSVDDGQTLVALTSPRRIFCIHCM